MSLAACPSGWWRWPAPAKLNLFLRLVGRRSDGYHLLQTVFQLLDWGDAVDLRPRADGAIRLLAGAPGVAAEDDLAVRAARTLQRATGTLLGADILVHKRIPLGGGFGGGSSDAASVLVGLNALWHTGLTPAALGELGLRLGADVPVFVHGRTAWAEGVGERLQALDLPVQFAVLVDTGEQVSTAELFQAPELTRNAPALTMADFAFDRVGENAFAPLLAARSPRVAAALQAIAGLGRGGLTGTGGGCFLLAGSLADAEAASRQLSAYGRCSLARTVNRSPLLQALQQLGATTAAVAADG